VCCRCDFWHICFVEIFVQVILNPIMSSNNGPLNNDPFFRGLSNAVDRAIGASYDNPRESKLRATLHGAYHFAQCLKEKNPREFMRAKDQWNAGFGGRTDHLKRWDQQNKKKWYAIRVMIQFLLQPDVQMNVWTLFLAKQRFALLIYLYIAYIRCWLGFLHF